jgi:hypothetical protein
LKLANEYGFIAASFLDSLSPTEKILIDYDIRNRLVDTLNKIEKDRQKESDDKQNMPGLKQRLTIDELIERQRQNKDVEVQ